MQPATWRAWRARCDAPGLSIATAAPSPARPPQPTGHTHMGRPQGPSSTGNNSTSTPWGTLVRSRGAFHCISTAARLLSSHSLATVKVQQHWLLPDQVVQPAKELDTHSDTCQDIRRCCALWPAQRAGLWEALGAKPLCPAAAELTIPSPCMLALFCLQASGRT